jgi:hypothetical protein
MSKIYLFFILIGIILGIFASQFIIPKLETLWLPIFEMYLEEQTPAPFAQILLPEKETRAVCKETQRGKWAEVVLEQQKLRMCENGNLMQEFQISSGKKESPTPTGWFRVIYKTPVLYSNLAQSWMPFWVGFGGDYGFHELPVSKEKEARVGGDKIGQPDSIGCIRLNVGDAEKFYKWAEIETRIVILEK